MKQGKIATEILMVMITIVITSSIIFLLIQAGTIEVQGSSSGTSLLNANFLPMGRVGNVVIKDFVFCSYIDEEYNCLGESNEFYLGEEAYFRFVVETSTFNGQIMLVKNYRIKDANGKVLLEVDEKNNFNYDLQSEETLEAVTFKDYFFVGEELEYGKYTLELIIRNPLLDKMSTLSQDFMLVEEEWVAYESDVEEFEEDHI